MENHPIPQDITNFQFKLIGDMTVKQFAYLATGSILGWIAFSLPVDFLIRFPFTAIFIFFGVSFAFFSIEGRPVDAMIINFIKAAFSPTQYVYQKTALLPAQNANAPQNVNFNSGISLKTDDKKEKDELDKKESTFFNMLSQMLNPPSSGTTAATANDVTRPYIVSVSEDGKEKKKENPKGELIHEEPRVEVLVQESQTIEQELTKAKEEEKKEVGSQAYERAHQKVLELEKLLNDTLSQKQSLEKELFDLKRQLEESKRQVYRPSVGMPTQETKNVRTISKEMGKSAGIPNAPEFPNVISGIIKDPRGNPLPNILVEVKDKEANPVRAFKTNALGQFSASTPLVNGGYTIEFEDPHGMNKFDKVAFQADGNIILPIEILSIDTREELRKSLFN